MPERLIYLATYPEQLQPEVNTDDAMCNQRCGKGRIKVSNPNLHERQRPVSLDVDVNAATPCQTSDQFNIRLNLLPAWVCDHIRRAWLSLA